MLLENMDFMIVTAAVFLPNQWTFINIWENQKQSNYSPSMRSGICLVEPIPTQTSSFLLVRYSAPQSSKEISGKTVLATHHAAWWWSFKPFSDRKGSVSLQFIQSVIHPGPWAHIQIAVVSTCLVSADWYLMSDVLCHTSRVSCLMFYVWRHMSHDRHLMLYVWYLSHARCLISDVGGLMWDIWCLMYGVWCPISDVRRFMSNVWCFTCDVRYDWWQTSDVICLVSVRHLTSDVGGLMWQVSCLMSGVWYLMFDIWCLMLCLVVRHLVRHDSWCQTSHVCCFMSGVYMMSDVWYLMLEVWCQTSDVSCMVSDVQCLMSDVRRFMSNVWCFTCDVRCLMTDIWCYMSGVCQTSDIWCRRSDVTGLMSHVWCLIFDVWHLMPDVWCLLDCIVTQ